MQNNHCTRKQLADLLHSGVEVCDETLERHLESCARCRSELETLAGTQNWWTEVNAQLSTVDELSVSSARSSQERGDASRYALQLLDPPGHPEMLGRIGRFDVERVVGQGGFGIVFKGHDTELNRAVAIKVLSPHLASSGVARKRFAREAQAAAAVNHPNVVPIHAVDANADVPYLVMTFVPGHSLQGIVNKYGPLEPKSIVRIAMQIASGLAAAHAQGLVHRDIKPANILLENDLNRAMITDFGLARAADDAAATQTGWLAGTPHYMSPEQARGNDIDTRSDLFSLGSVLYFMATGREPFRGETPLAVLRMIGEHQPLPAHSINSDIPRVLSTAIDRLLEKNPKDRFASAAELEIWLEQFLAYLQHPQSARPPRIATTQRTKKRTRILAAAIAMILTSVVCGWLFQDYWTINQSSTKANTDATVDAISWRQSLDELRQEQQFLDDINILQNEISQFETVMHQSTTIVFGSESDSLESNIEIVREQIQNLEQILKE